MNDTRGSQDSLYSLPTALQLLEKYKNLLVKIGTVCVICLVFYYAGIRTGVQLVGSPETVVANPSPSPTPASTPIPTPEAPTPTHLEKYKDFEIGAYLVAVSSGASDDYLYLYKIVPVEDGLPVQDQNVSIYATAFNEYSGPVFDVVGNSIYMVDQRSNSILVYELLADSKMIGLDRDGKETFKNYYSLKYIQTVKLPAYDMGELYGIECSGTECEVSTAFHMEAGCDLKFSAVTNTFSNEVPVCTNHIGATSAPQQLEQ